MTTMRLTKEQLENFTSWDEYIITLKPKNKGTKETKSKIPLDVEAKRQRQAGYMRKYYEKNRPVILERLKKFYHEGKVDGQESQKEKQAKYYKQYYQIHKEEILTREKNKRREKNINKVETTD